MSNDERWNGDIAYAFSTHRASLRMFCLWPLQTKTVYTRILWGIFLIAQFMILPYVLLDIRDSANNVGMNNIETILYGGAMLTGTVKYVSLTFHQKKLAVNIDSAIDDWLLVKDDKEAREIMRNHAFRARILTFVLLYSAGVCISLYILVIVVINVKQIFFTDLSSIDVDTNTTNWLLLIPCGPLSRSVTGSQYAVIIVTQIFQMLCICSIQCIVDSFYFNVVMHLAGQLELLKNKFKIFANEFDTEPKCRQKFVDLIDRHGELMEFYQNLEDAFHFMILFQLVTVTIMLALLGLRMNMCLNGNNHVEFTKSALVMNYLLLQSLVYTYGGDFLQRESEGIFHGLYETSWFTLPLALMRDLHFAMMRSSIPFRLTGGKFFYVNRETMMYILKTAASYVSVLRIALRD